MVDATTAHPDDLNPTPASWSGRRRFHFVQDVATPHNNALLRQLVKVPNVDLRIAYARRDTPDYPLAAQLVDEIQPAHVYGSILPNPLLLIRAILFPRDRWLIVAWSNPTTRILIVWFWMTRRRFNCWIDVPPPTTPRRLRLRRIVLRLLRSSRVRMFAVGSTGVEYLLDAGFSPEKVLNLPIAVDVRSSVTAGSWRSMLNLSDDKLLLVTGSRLTLEKGFDVLLHAIDQLGSNVRERLRTVIVGTGPYEHELRSIARQIALHENEVTFINWLPFEDFSSLVGDADLVVHPARMDSFGGISLLARAMSKPLVASRGAGAAIDIVQPGVNGWLYESEDSSALAAILNEVVRVACLRLDAARAMSAVSQEGSPAFVAERLVRNAW